MESVLLLFTQKVFLKQSVDALTKAGMIKGCRIPNEGLTKIFRCVLNTTKRSLAMLIGEQFTEQLFDLGDINFVGRKDHRLKFFA